MLVFDVRKNKEYSSGVSVELYWGTKEFHNKKNYYITSFGSLVWMSTWSKQIKSYHYFVLCLSENIVMYMALLADHIKITIEVI